MGNGNKIIRRGEGVKWKVSRGAEFDFFGAWNIK